MSAGNQPRGVTSVLIVSASTSAAIGPMTAMSARFS